MSGFRDSNLTITMANREALESLEPLNPLTPEMAIWRVHCCSSLLVNSNVPNISTVYLSGRLLENANMEALRKI